MKTAGQILKGKRAVREEMDRLLPKAQSDALWRKAEARLEGILKRYEALSGRVRLHTDHYIFPSAAIYLTLREAVDPAIAYAVIENAAIKNSTKTGRKIAGMLRLPGMKRLFVWIWDPMTRKMFASESGFENVFYPRKKGEYRMDVVACPYDRYFTQLGCPELTKIFCANDNRCYGNLPGVEFLRSGTIGTGADRCDFLMRRV